MGLYDDRGNASFPRWGVDGSENISADVTEPPTGQKDAGWEPGIDRPPAEWFNWHMFAAYFAAKYLENTFKGILPNYFLPTGNSNPSTALEVTDIVAGGLSLDVAAGRAWTTSGAMAELATADTVTLTTAHATLDRIDTVVLDVTTGTTVLTAVAGTPSATPSAPSLTDDQVPLADVTVAATQTELTSGDITDRRRFGVPVQANSEEYNTAVTQILTIPAVALVEDTEADINRATLQYVTLDSGATSVDLYGAVNLPHGATVTEFSVITDHGDALHETRAFLYEKDWTSTASATNMASITHNGSTTLTKTTTTSITSPVIDNENNGYTVLLQIFDNAGAGVPAVYGVQIKYTLAKPITPI